MTPDEIIDAIMAREGGYVNHPADRGGPTKFGITQATLSHHRGSAQSATDVQLLTETEARTIYKQGYLAPFARFEDPNLLALCVDSAVQHGPAKVNAWLHDIPSSAPDVNYRMLLRRRIEYYGEIITSNPSQATFAKGWMRRVAEFVR